MGSGDFHFHIHFPHLHFHHHHHHHHGGGGGKREERRDIPKGCLAVMVGQGAEPPQRFVIPVMYINHPLFMRLLKEAEEEYGFEHTGPLNIPCHVEEFRRLQGKIDRENSGHHGGGGGHQNWCFKA